MVGLHAGKGDARGARVRADASLAWSVLDPALSRVGIQKSRLKAQPRDSTVPLTAPVTITIAVTLTLTLTLTLSLSLLQGMCCSTPSVHWHTKPTAPRSPTLLRTNSLGRCVTLTLTLTLTRTLTVP